MSQRAPSDQFALGLEQLASLLDAIEEHVLVVSAEGSILFASPSLGELIGRSADDCAGHPVSNLFHEEDRPVVQRVLRESSFIVKARSRCRLRTRHGDFRWFNLVVQARLKDPAVQGLVLLLSDASATHRMEAERQVISEVVHALNETSNLDQLLGRIHQALKGVVYAENCFVALYDAEIDSFHFPFLVDQFDVAPPPQKVGRSCTALVFRTGRAMLIPQSEFDRLVAEGQVELVGSPSPSWLGVPLKTPSATIGVLVVQQRGITRRFAGIEYAGGDVYRLTPRGQ